MPLIANNAVSTLAAQLGTADTTIVLRAGSGSAFPSPTGGDWFPITIVMPSGDFEIAHCTDRSSDVLTVVRGREGTSAKEFNVGDRIELRLTSGTLTTMFSDLREDLQGEMQAGDAAVQSGASTALEGVRANLQQQITDNQASTTAALATKFDKAGGTITGNVTLTADLTTYRPASPGTGVIFLGNSGARYLHWDGSNYVMPGAHLYVNGNSVWTTGNFNPANYLPLSGGTITGGFQINSTAPQINLYDTDWGMRYLHSNGGLVGFLTSGGGWACYSQNDGTFIASGNIGAYSDRKHKKRIRPIRGALALIERLRGVRYIDKRTGAQRVGVIAQEVREALPEVVGSGPDGLHVDYGNIVGPLIEAVKELAARVRKLEGR